MLASFLPRYLDFHLDREERERFLLASILPIFVVLANVVMLAMELLYGFPYLDEPLRDAEYRIYSVLGRLASGASVLTLATLIFLSIGRPTYSVGSWAAAIAGAIAGSLVLLVASALPGLFYRPFDDSVKSWHVQWSTHASSTLALVAAGYGFLAYRGLSTEKWDDVTADFEAEDDQPREL